jgi:hypothetical protein
MAHTHKAEPPKPYRKEIKEWRRLTNRAFRTANHRAVRAIAAGRAEPDDLALPVQRGTGGWLTW